MIRRVSMTLVALDLRHQGVAAAGAQGSTVDVIGRWKRRHLQLGRDFVEESFTLADGRTLFYKQPEAHVIHWFLCSSLSVHSVQCSIPNLVPLR